MSDWVSLALLREAQMMGRPVEYRGAWETIFHGGDAASRVFRVLVYDVEPRTFGNIVVHESRFSVEDGAGNRSGGIIGATP
jgi:hypothetical protein